MKKVYLGDSVYVEFDGYGIVLTTENGAGPSNTIALEPQVFHNLEAYMEALARNEADVRRDDEENKKEDSWGTDASGEVSEESP